MKKVIIYGKNNCLWCEKAKNLLDEFSIPYSYRDIDGKFTINDMYEDLCACSNIETSEIEEIHTVPQIIFVHYDNSFEYIGEFNFFQKVINAELRFAGSIKNGFRDDPCKFFYKKKDGTIREAYGTTLSYMIPEELRPKGKIKTENPFYIHYYDLDKKGWRAFYSDAFIEGYL